MKEEMVDIVDENDKVIDTVTRKKMRKENLLHRDVKIAVFNSKGEVFVQKRKNTKDIFPSYYSACVGGTVASGEDCDETAVREVEEELGVKNTKVKYHFKDKYIGGTKVISRVYSCVYDGKITLQEEEVEKGSFLPVKKVLEHMKKEKYCPDDIPMFRKLIRLMKK